MCNESSANSLLLIAKKSVSSRLTFAVFSEFDHGGLFDVKWLGLGNTVRDTIIRIGNNGRAIEAHGGIKI
jgi:hypothetical protein